MKGDPPGFGPQDFTIVEDSRTGAIAATMNLISQTWSYEVVEFAVGRIELVGTDPDYRLRGLMRATSDRRWKWSTSIGGAGCWMGSVGCIVEGSGTMGRTLLALNRAPAG